MYALCDPEKKHLRLFGLPDKTWTLNEPLDKAVPDTPEPTPGISLARDTMDRYAWHDFVARHCDAWIMALAVNLGSSPGLNTEFRRELLSMINNLPTIHEVLTGAAEEPTNERSPDSSNSKKSASDQPPPTTEEYPASCSKRAREA